MPSTFPAPDSGWSLADAGRVLGTVPSLAEAVTGGEEVIVGLPSHSIATFAVLLPEVESTLQESMLFAQIERRGLAARQGETAFDFEKVGKLGSEDAWIVNVVSTLPEDSIALAAHGYTTSAALRPVPAGGCALWKEHGRLVFGAWMAGRPAHIQVLAGATEVNAATAREIQLTLLGMQGDPALASQKWSGVEVAIDGIPSTDWKDFAKILADGLQVTATQTSPGRTLENPVARDRLLPPAVRRWQQSRRSLRRNLILIGAGLVVYAIVATLLWQSARRTEARRTDLERQISIVAPDAEQLQADNAQWQRLEPAFEKDLFPVVQLSRITAAMPVSGVVLREFRTTDRTIRLRGQARDVQLANRLIEDLRALDAFKRYEWSMPNPKVEKNNTATFEIEGKPKNASPES
jgi:hypothetical protein